MELIANRNSDYVLVAQAVVKRTLQLQKRVDEARASNIGYEVARRLSG